MSYESILDTIGNTPVVKLQHLAPKGIAPLNVDALDRTYYVGTTGFAHSIKQDTGTMPASVKFSGRSNDW